MKQTGTKYYNGILYKIVAIDIGNSRAKVLFENTFKSFDYSDNWESRILNLFLNQLDIPFLIGISSVNQERYNQLLEGLNRLKNSLIKNTEDLLPLQTKLIYSHISGIGNDRLLGMLGAIAHISPPLITVDCGTAVTINAVDFSGKCLGGAIFGGIKTQVQALFQMTDALPEIEIKFDGNYLGKSTEKAMQIGIIAGVAGAVKEIVNQIIMQAFHGKKVPVYITGGDSELLAGTLQNANFPLQINRTLVLDGITYLLHSL